MSLLASLRVALSADTAQFDASMKRAQRTANQTRSSFQKSFGGLGGLVKSAFAGIASGISVGLLAQGAKAALDYAASIGEMAQQLGVSTRDLQTFRYAAGQVGVSQEQLENGLGKLTVTLGRVAAGAKAPTEALRAIGIEARDIAGLDTGEAFRKIADGLEKIPDRAQRAAVEVALFGKSGAALDNLLAGGSQALNELSRAAEELGIVLSDDQIQSADETADKLEALKTVLSAQIAGIVADNADSILQLANSIAQLLSVAGKAIGILANFRSQLVATEAKGRNFNPFLSDKSRQENRATIFRENAKMLAGGRRFDTGQKIKVSGGGSVGKFLAGGGGGGRGGGGGSDDAERKRQEALRDAYRFDQDMRRSQMDILRAQQQLANDYVERTQLSIQMLDLERKGFEAQLAYDVASGELTKVQADQLKAQYEKKDALERQAILEEEEADRKRDYYALEQADFEIARDRLESERQLANNSAERRDIELRLLDLAYRQERARLEAVLADETSSHAAQEEARRRLAALNKTYSNDRQGVMRDTAGPFEQARLEYGDLTDEMENLKVQGIMGVADALTSLTGGFENFKQTAINAIKQIIAEFIRLQLMKALFSAFGGPGLSPGAASSGASFGASIFAGGGSFLPAFATGGGFTIMGNRGVDQNTLSLNGLPIARVSHGERINVGTGEGSGHSINAPITFNINGNPSRATMDQIATRTRTAISSASRKGF